MTIEHIEHIILPDGENCLKEYEMARCDMCFKEKPSLAQPLPKSPSVVCKGCFYEIDRVIGFLMHYGAAILVQGELAPLNPPKRKKKATKDTPPTHTT